MTTNIFDVAITLAKELNTEAKVPQDRHADLVLRKEFDDHEVMEIMLKGVNLDARLWHESECVWLQLDLSEVAAHGDADW